MWPHYTPYPILIWTLAVTWSCQLYYTSILTQIDADRDASCSIGADALDSAPCTGSNMQCVAISNQVWHVHTANRNGPAIIVPLVRQVKLAQVVLIVSNSQACQIDVATIPRHDDVIAQNLGAKDPSPGGRS